MIGLGILTYNRADNLRQVIDSLKENNYGGADKIVIVEDGSTNPEQYDEILLEADKEGISVISNIMNKGVGISKNRALKYLIALGCDHLFLMEDDILMKDPETCTKYVDYAKEVGVQHLNFGLHGPDNGEYLRLEVEGRSCFPNCVGAFCYYTKTVLDDVGFFDEYFVNAWEHIEHTLRICDAETYYHPPFWYFVDHPESNHLLMEIPGSATIGVIRDRSDYIQNIKDGKEYWHNKCSGNLLPEHPKKWGKYSYNYKAIPCRKQ